MENVEKAALVTGASRGIGRAVAIALAKKGYAVAVNYAGSQKAAEDVKAAIEAEGGRAIVIQGDVSKAEDVEKVFAAVKAEFGRLDVLVNNAGTDNSTWLTRLKQSEWDAVCNLNMKAPYTMMKYAIPHLVKTKGCIVNTASVAGVYGCPTGLPYPASKAALIAMTKSVAYSFANKGVRVNAVAPGVVNTDMVANMPQFAKDSVGDTIPMKRFAEPEDIANGILFLSSSAASYVTGVCLQIDGGYRPNNLPK